MRYDDKGRKVKPKTFCANCGDQVSTRGRPPKKLGVRYCVKLECQAARQRAVREREHRPAPRPAPTQCSGCGKILPARQWRSEDALGRFCTKAACQRRRDEVREQAKVGEVVEHLAKIARLEETIRVALDATVRARVHCQKCGLLEAVQGYGHPTEEYAPCDGTLEDVGRGRDVDWVTVFALLWPSGRHYEPVE